MLVSTIVSFVCRGQEKPRQPKGRRTVSKTTKTCMINTFHWQVQTKERAGARAGGKIPKADQETRNTMYQRPCVSASATEQPHVPPVCLWYMLSRLNGPTSYPDLLSLSLAKKNHMLRASGFLFLYTRASTSSVQRFNVYVNLASLFYHQRLKLQPFETKPCSLCIT